MTGPGLLPVYNWRGGLNRSFRWLAALRFARQSLGKTNSFTHALIVCVACAVGWIFAWEECVAQPPAHIGLHFLDETTEIPSFPFPGFVNGMFVDDFDHDAYLMTDPSSAAFAQGGVSELLPSGTRVASLDESELRQLITARVESYFQRALFDDGVAGSQTLGINFYVGPVPDHLPGRRLNVVLGDHRFTNLLGLARTGAITNPDTPDDSYEAYVSLKGLDQLTGVSLSSLDDVVNVIANTAAHEIGHLFGAEHVDAGEPPYPLLDNTVPNIERELDRTLITQSLDTISMATSVYNIADLNLDGDVDVFAFDPVSQTVSGDASLLLANLETMTGALRREGDLNDDGDVDVSDFDPLSGVNSGDAAILLANLGFGSSAVSRRSIPTISVPEPASGFLLLAVSQAFLLKRRRV